MRNLLIYSQVFDGDYYNNNGYICSFKNSETADKVIKILNDFVNNTCVEYFTKELMKIDNHSNDFYNKDFVLKDFLKEKKLEEILKNNLLKILETLEVKNFIDKLKEEMSYIYLEEETFKKKEILEL